MRAILLAIVAGFALGLGLYGFGTSPTTSLGELHGSLPLEQLNRNTITQLTKTKTTPGSHTYAGLNPGLNQNVIDGQPTIVCTTDTRLYDPLARAVTIWNQALSNLRFGEEGTEGPLLLHRSSTEQRPASCADVVGERDIDVEVLVADECDNPRAIACYSAMPQRSPRRYLFMTRNGDQTHSTIFYQQENNITIDTLVHELGHVLGLRDYETTGEAPNIVEGCIPLHNGVRSDNPVNIDPLKNHYSVMRNQASAECSTVGDGGTITGRDLRDFYEAYRIGAITHVSISGPITVSDGTLSARLKWGSTGIKEASHASSHVAILRQATGSSEWQVVQHMPLIDGNTGEPREQLAFTDANGIARLYKLVGVTRGDEG